MKLNKTKTASFIMSCFFLFLVVGCESKKEEPKPADPAPAAAPAATPAAAPAATPAAAPAATPAAAPAKKGMDTSGTKGKPVVTGDAPQPPAAN